MIHARRKHCHSLIDQECLQDKIEQWQKENPTTNIYSRPKGIVKETTNERNGDDVWDEIDEVKLKSASETSLLFVYQSEWQKRLLNPHGKEVVLLDATYRTMQYALPLFFFVVKKNIDYQIVATFVTENETQDCIEESLQIIKSWNEDFLTQDGMTDYYTEEINAMENFFPGIVVFT